MPGIEEVGDGAGTTVGAVPLVEDDGDEGGEALAWLGASVEIFERADGVAEDDERERGHRAAVVLEEEMESDVGACVGPDAEDEVGEAGAEGVVDEAVVVGLEGVEVELQEEALREDGAEDGASVLLASEDLAEEAVVGLGRGGFVAFRWIGVRGRGRWFGLGHRLLR